MCRRTFGVSREVTEARIAQSNVQFREKVDDLLMDREDLSNTINLLKTELTGRCGRHAWRRAPVLAGPLCLSSRHTPLHCSRQHPAGAIYEQGPGDGR